MTSNTQQTNHIKRTQNKQTRPIASQRKQATNNRRERQKLQHHNKHYVLNQNRQPIPIKQHNTNIKRQKTHTHTKQDI